MKIKKFKNFINEDSFQGRYEKEDVDLEKLIGEEVEKFLDKMGMLGESPDSMWYNVKYDGNEIEVNTNENPKNHFPEEALEHMAKDIEMELAKPLIDKLSGYPVQEDYVLYEIGAGGFTLRHKNY